MWKVSLQMNNELKAIYSLHSVYIYIFFLHWSMLYIFYVDYLGLGKYIFNVIPHFAIYLIV